MQFRRWLMENTGITTQHFWDLADEQRGEPESAMLLVQHAYGGGILNVVVEHIGDLTHRMSEKPTFATAGYEFVKPKVEKLLSWMERGQYDWKPGGSFEDEVRSIKGRNAEYLHPKDAGAQMAWFSTLKDALQKYADAHRKLPVYNEAQRHARDAAVAVGESRYGDAINHLKELQKHLGNRDEWVKFAHAGLDETPQG